MAKNPNSKSLFIRKYRKLTRDPKSFFEDSDNPVVRHLGGLAVHARDRVTKRRDGVHSHLHELRRSQYRSGALRRPTSARDLFHEPFVAVIGDLGLPQCKKYRVLQKLEILEKAGIKCGYSHWMDVPRATSLLQNASCVIFYRTHATASFCELVAEAVRLGLTIGYDIDDPIFDLAIYSENPNLDFITKREKNALLSQTSEYLAALRMADFVITSTPYMKECIQRSFRGPVYLWRNAVDSESVHAASLATDKRAAPASPGTITIGYASGSRAHEADFRTIESVLLQVLEAHPNVRIQVIGYADLPETFKPYARRIATEPVATYPAYLGLLARCDIALVPLVIDEFNECKSAVRFLDAAAVRVPVIAAATGDFKNVVVHGKNGLLAANEAEWLQAIELLIGDEAKRREIADGAKRHAEAVRVSSETFESFDTGVRRALDFRR